MKRSLYLLMLLLLAGCVHPTDDILRRAASVVQEHPDSALQILSVCDHKHLHGESKARYAVLYIMAQDKKGVDVRNDSLLSPAYDYYRHNTSDTLAARAYFYMGKYYWLRDSLDSSIECLQRSIQLAGQRQDFYTEYLALFVLSRNLMLVDSPLALSSARRAYEICDEKCNADAYNKVCLLKNIGLGYECCGYPDSSFIYYDKALTIAEQSGDDEIKAIVFHDMAATYLGMNEYQNAYTYALKAWNLFPEHDENLVLMMGQCMAGLDSLGQAEEMLQAVAEVGSLPSRFSAFTSLRDLSRKKGDMDNVINYSDSAQYYGEMMRMESSKANLKYMEELYDERLAKDKIAHRLRVQRLTTALISIIVLALIIFFIQSHRLTRRKLSYEKEQRQMADLLRTQEERRHEAEEKLFREQLKNHETRLSLLRSFLLSKVDVLQRIHSNDDEEKAVRLSDKDWTELEFVLNESDNGFVTRLSTEYPNLSTDELRLCMLLRLNIENKTLENIFFLSKQYIRQKQTILKKKMRMGDSPLSLRDYLASF